MLYELRTTICQPSAVGRVVALAGEFATQSKQAGRLEGAWTTDIGALCRLLELRSHPDMEAVTATAGLTEQHPEIRDAVTSVETTLLAPVLPFQPVGGTGHVYEWRRYRTRPGFRDEWLKLFISVMPARERYSARVGLWRTVGGSGDEVSQLWVYDDLNQRATVRAKVMQDPEWQALLKNAPQLLSEMHSAILVPTSYSQLR
jgi:hypothetical protein